MRVPPSLTRRGADAVSAFIASGTFALLALALVVTWTGVMLAILLWPQNFSTIGSFAANFRVWCFGYDPLTGHFNKAQVLMVFLDPLFFGGIIGWFWKDSLKKVWAHKVKMISLLGSSLTIVLLILGGIGWSQAAQNGADLADFQLVRSHEQAPFFNLTDQNNHSYQIQPGRITLVSAFYSHCEHTCPQLIEQARRALKKAQIDLSQVDVAFITLDPERDSVERLQKTVNRLNLGPAWHLLTGNPQEVNRVLDEYHVARVRDASGTIGHSNLFYVVNQKGELAFRIGLGTVQEMWLKEALELLMRE